MERVSPIKSHTAMVLTRAESLIREMAWLVSGGRSYPVISFVPGEDDKYLRINSLPYVIESEITMFRITNEVSDNREFPQGKTLMFGGMN